MLLFANGELGPVPAFCQGGIPFPAGAPGSLIVSGTPPLPPAIRVSVYGPALMALIREEAGDGILSAINFGFKVQRLPGGRETRWRSSSTARSCPKSGEGRTDHA